MAEIIFDMPSCQKTILTLVYLSGNVCKSGPLHFGSEKSFPSNFVQETTLGDK